MDALGERLIIHYEKLAEGEILQHVGRTRDVKLQSNVTAEGIRRKRLNVDRHISQMNGRSHRKMEPVEIHGSSSRDNITSYSGST
jgi:hypothetical protein